MKVMVSSPWGQKYRCLHNVLIQSEKRKMLLEAEENKMEMYEKEYEQVVADWKAGLPIRKQVSYFFFLLFSNSNNFKNDGPQFEWRLGKGLCIKSF